MKKRNNHNAGKTRATPKTPASSNASPSEEQIRARAHEIFLKRGGTPGHALEDWVAAERELRPGGR